jgi:N-acetylglucosaminyl-diphospho-decaprenol L-rhamnosyltransferase
MKTAVIDSLQQRAYTTQDKVRPGRALRDVGVPARSAAFHGLSVSVVSHCHGPMITSLLGALASKTDSVAEVLVTINVPEAMCFDPDVYPFPVRVIRNERPCGFGENHNRAAQLAQTDRYCVLNPDVELHGDPFAAMIDTLNDPTVGVVGPAVFSSDGSPQDHARRFPTVGSLMKKALTGERPLEYQLDSEPIEPDWIAGLCMVFRAETFQRLGGFDTDYFLYYEDVDLCARARAAGLRVLVQPAAKLVHDGQRRSWTHPFYTAMHLKSMMRYFAADPSRPRAPLVGIAPERPARASRQPQSIL